ncbi:MAG: deoxynucleoside kinase [Candidatus Hatepunaea meridiana]|nr:deoxynucleoside kinase [Candidatus Hatepunaea meridiana]
MSIIRGTYIAVEGSIGVGKTSLARIIAQEMEAKLVLEDEIKNPFLPDFYRDPHRFALRTQLSFLLYRHEQQSSLSQLSLFQMAIVSDYIFDKDRIFANLNLDERELKLYNQVADLLESDVLTPDLVIYLQASPERLLTNIRIRDIDYERSITIEYLKNLCEAYSQFFFHWDKSPLLIVNATRMDFVNNEKHRQMLLKVVKEMPAGTSYFNPET